MGMLWLCEVLGKEITFGVRDSALSAFYDLTSWAKYLAVLSLVFFPHEVGIIGNKSECIRINVCENALYKQLSSV